MLILFFLGFCAWTNRNRTPYILQVLDFAIFFLENFLPVLHFAKFVKATRQLKAVEIKKVLPQH